MLQKPGRHFLQIPGPTPLPERVAQAISRSTIDHRGPEFAQLTLGIFERLRTVFGTTDPIAIYPSSASGAWEAALANTLSPGDRVLFCTSGQFAAQWSKVASRFGLHVEELVGDWRLRVDPDQVTTKLNDGRTVTGLVGPSYRDHTRPGETAAPTDVAVEDNATVRRYRALVLPISEQGA